VRQKVYGLEANPVTDSSLQPAQNIDAPALPRRAPLVYRATLLSTQSLCLPHVAGTLPGAASARPHGRVMPVWPTSGSARNGAQGG
jgi:hypothetical protein